VSYGYNGSSNQEPWQSLMLCSELSGFPFYIWDCKLQSILYLGFEFGIIVRLNSCKCDQVKQGQEIDY
jgi:hypothetical protein